MSLFENLAISLKINIYGEQAMILFAQAGVAERHEFQMRGIPSFGLRRSLQLHVPINAPRAEPWRLAVTLTILHEMPCTLQCHSSSEQSRMVVSQYRCPQPQPM
jgi:hypothetical protein